MGKKAVTHNYSIRTIWGIAKSPELLLSDEELHLVVSAQTGKESIKSLNNREIGKVVGVLQSMKDSSKGNKKDGKKRSYTGQGNPATENQRKKIYMLRKEIGWEEEKRIDGFCKKMFGVERLEWLNYVQCSKLIEALKKMLERKKVDDAG